MDVNLFTQMLKDLSTKQDSIKSTADYCWRNRVSAEDCIKTIEKEMLQARKQQKRLYFYLLHELLRYSAAEKPHTYVKLIGSKIKSLVMDFSRTVDNYAEANEVSRLIQHWYTEQLFVESFIDRLRQIINPACKRLLDLAEQSKVQKLNLKYSKTFLTDYQAVQQFPPAKKMYADTITRSEIQSKLIRFNNEFGKLDLSSPNPQAGQRASEMLRVAEEYRQTLMKLITEYHTDYRLLVESFKSEVSIIQKQL